MGPTAGAGAPPSDAAPRGAPARGGTGRRGRPTLRDVACSLGVSVATVSNAYNRPDQLSRALRLRVLERAEALGYRGPGAEGRLLRTGHAGAIALYQCEPLGYAVADPHALAFAAGVAELCQDHQAGLLVLPALPLKRGEHPRPPAALDTAAVDGIVLQCLAEDDPAIERALARGRPVVGVDMEPRADFPVVGVDDRRGAALAMGRVAPMGPVAVLSLPLDPRRRAGRAAPAELAAARFGTTRRRWEGYAAALRQVGQDPDAVPVVAVAANAPADARAGAEALLALRPRPRAVAAMSDVLALGVLEAARGLSVPRDLAVVGFDDAPAAAAAGLTTIRQDAAAKGRAAARLLLEPDTPLPRLGVDLVVRDTA